MIGTSTEWFNYNEANFEAATSLADQIREQDQVYRELRAENDTAATDDPCGAENKYLADEQLATFKMLVHVCAATPYEELGHKDIQTEAALAKVSLQLTGMSKDLHSENKTVYRAKRPTADPQDSGAPEYRQLNSERVALTKFFVKYGEAWPIPQLIPPKQRLEIARPLFKHDVQLTTATTEQSGCETWEIAFRDVVAAAVEQLDDWTLMEDTEVLWASVSQRSLSMKVGTDRMMAKALRRGIISKEQAEAGKKAMVQTSQLVCMLVQDTPVYKQNAMATKAHTKKAFSIAETTVSEYLEAKRAKATQ